MEDNLCPDTQEAYNRLDRTSQSFGKGPYKATFKGLDGLHVANRTYIRKEWLQDGAYYYGTCRNASIARWDAKENKFWYWRSKFGRSFIEEINHPEDDNGFDLFFPQEGPIYVKEIPTPNHKL